MLKMIFADQTQNRIGEVDRHDTATKLKENAGVFDVNDELTLFTVMGGVLKPVGINRFFTMLVIHERFSSKLEKELSSKVIWDHFDSMYDMAVLHESETLPFPNDEVDFELPEEFDDLLSETFGVTTSRTSDENEVTKNSTSLKALKKLNASKLKQSTTPSADVKNTFLTPVSIKPTKNFVGGRSEQRPPTSENNIKVKQESPLPAKINKVKRSSSPFSTKNGKSESSAIKNESTESLGGKKTPKVDKNLAVAKKVPKTEPIPINSSSKKTMKQELNANSVRQVKHETPDNSVKKVKTEKEQNKKGKISTPLENSKKVSKPDGKTPEPENSHKKSSDISGNKTNKNSTSFGKANKLEEMETPVSSGSRKSSVVKVVEIKDKKRKRLTEDSGKKVTAVAKRRRT